MELLPARWATCSPKCEDNVADIEPYRQLVIRPLKAIYEDESQPDRLRVRAAIPLTTQDRSIVQRLSERLITSQTHPLEFPVLQTVLAQFAPVVIPNLRSQLKDDTLPSGKRFRILCRLLNLDQRSGDLVDEVPPLRIL